MKQASACVLYLCILGSAWAQPGDAQASADIAGARRQIEESRSHETARFDAMDAQCQTRFAVNDCLRTSQTQRRAAMTDLRKREANLNEKERRQRGQDQVQRAEQKAQERREQDQEVTDAHAARLAQQAQKQSTQDEKRAANRNIALNPPPPKTPPAKPQAGPLPAQQAANRSEYERRQAEARQHKLELDKRNAEKTGKPASTLPLPAN